MRLLIVTQKVDKEDENLGAFYPWFEELGKNFDETVIIASSIGVADFPSNIKTFSFGKGKGAHKIVQIWKFWELFSEHYAACDAVLFHQIPEFVLAAAPLLMSLKRRSALWYAHGAISWKLRIAERIIGTVLTSSPSGFRMRSKKVISVGQAVDTNRFRPREGVMQAAGGIRLVSAGRISPVKDYETMILAGKILERAWQKPWVLTIVGGPLMARDHTYLVSLKQNVREAGLESHIHFAGARPFSEIPTLFQEEDIFLNLSRTGSLDKAVLEAMSSGLTVISSNSAYRYLLPPKYFLEHVTPEFLAERIQMLADELRPNRALRDIVIAHHSLPHTIDRVSAVLKGN